MSFYSRVILWRASGIYPSRTLALVVVDASAPRVCPRARSFVALPPGNSIPGGGALPGDMS